MAKAAAHRHSQQEAVFQDESPPPLEAQVQQQQEADKAGRQELRMKVLIRRR